MNIIRNKIKGDTILNEDTQLHGMIVGLTTVSENVILQLHGMVIGTVIIREGSTVYLHGMVNGSVINKGGHLEVFGIVNGKIIRESGETIVNPKAIVQNGIL